METPERYDSNGNPVEQSGLPLTGVDNQPSEGYWPGNDRFKDDSDMELILLHVLYENGLELGEYDRKIVRWFARFADWQTFATITGWIYRSGEAGRDDTP